MKKILFVITKANWGGAQRYVFDIATHLPKSDFEVSVAFGQEGLLAKKLEEVNVATLPIEAMRRNISISNDIKSFFELLRLFRMGKPDIVHLNSSKASGLGALAARIVGIKKIIFTVHGWPFLENRPVFAKILIWIASWFTALFCHKVICISDYDLRITKRMPFVNSKAVRIYNGVAPISFGSGEKIRTEFLAGVKITGTVGELTRNKNQISLIEQAKNNPDMHVAIVGGGEDLLYLKRKIEEYGLASKVKLFGFVPVEEVLTGFDVFALPSLKEGLPYVLLEAKLAGLPIVANRVGGVSEILDEKDMGKFSLERMLEKTIDLYNS